MHGEDTHAWAYVSCVLSVKSCNPGKTHVHRHGDTVRVQMHMVAVEMFQEERVL